MPIGAESGHPQALIVLGMGKLGGGELNLSSDIDLFFTYPESGTTINGRSQISNQEFFIKAGQSVIRYLDAPTADGFVFRVDMRLRPYGDSGPLVCNFDSLELYYQEQGRDWERLCLNEGPANNRCPGSERGFKRASECFCLSSLYRFWGD